MGRLRITIRALVTVVCCGCLPYRPHLEVITRLDKQHGTEAVITQPLPSSLAVRHETERHGIQLGQLLAAGTAHIRGSSPPTLVRYALALRGVQASSCRC